MNHSSSHPPVNLRPNNNCTCQIKSKQSPALYFDKKSFKYLIELKTARLALCLLSFLIPVTTVFTKNGKFKTNRLFSGGRRRFFASARDEFRDFNWKTGPNDDDDVAKCKISSSDIRSNGNGHSSVSTIVLDVETTLSSCSVSNYGTLRGRLEERRKKKRRNSKSLRFHRKALKAIDCASEASKWFRVKWNFCSPAFDHTQSPPPSAELREKANKMLVRL